MRAVFSLLLLLSSAIALAGSPRASFTRNMGQWPEHVLYRTVLPHGVLFVERSAFTYVLQSGGGHHQHGRQATEHVHDPLRSHAFRVHFVDGSASGSTAGHTQPHYENFFIGNDPAQWGTGCSVHGEVVLKEVWPGIDLRLDGMNGLKYELIVAPGADATRARFRYQGHQHLQLKNGTLVVSTTAGTVVEDAPYSFQLRGDGQQTVESAYSLEGDLLSFELPRGHDLSLPLTIDPTLSFASFSGSNASNFGFTATYDSQGHLYGGGIVFGAGYPTTLGVLDETYNGGTVDVGISKWSVDGSSLVWSTYFGGTGNESPHSMVVNANDELFVLGSTGSNNMPTTPGCFDASFGGGAALTFSGYGFNHENGTDIFVAHFNAAATALLGSTYLGGPANDGINEHLGLAHNYGDTFRGEIIVDANGNPIVASTTGSAGLPVVGGPQAAYGGGDQDGFTFRMDPGLTTLQWSTYIGGQGADASYSVQRDSSGDLFVTGGTTSNDLPMVGTPYQSAHAGNTDGFIMHYTTGGALIGSTYLGTPEYDQCYFVQLNTSDEVFVVGQTHGNYPVTPGKFTVAGSSQFMHKLNTDLGTSQWSTRFGNGTSQQDLSPTAFLVSDCGQIYFSGWGGTTNNTFGNFSSTTTGSPVTPDAFQPTTDGDDLYLMLLEPEANGLNYATFFGGTLTPEHVDGGTSRFDKNGTVYQAVCAGCQNSSDFPTTPGAWSNTNNSVGCNLGVFKFDLARGNAEISIDGPNMLCIPDTARFINNSTGGNTYAWDFGNGSTSAEELPYAVYTETGTFTVTLILSDDTGCNAPDTTSIQITAVEQTVATVEPVDPICLGLSVQLQASGGDTYTWVPPNGLNDPTLPDPLLTPSVSGTWSVIVSSFCGSDTASVSIDLGVPQGSAGEDAEICLGQSTLLQADGGGTYAWVPEPSLSGTESATPLATPDSTTTYIVLVTTPEGCETTDSVSVFVVEGTPARTLEDTSVCIGGSVQLIAGDADAYAWQSAPGITTLNVQDPLVSPIESTVYVVQLTNVCGQVLDSALVNVIVPQADAWPDSLVCPGEPVQLYATGGSTYTWSPISGLDDPFVQTPIAQVMSAITYTVIATDAFGCSASATVTLDTYPPSFVDAGPDRVIDPGDEVQLAAVGTGSFLWEPASTLDLADVQTPVARPDQSTAYTVTMTDANGCKVYDVVSVILTGTLFVPNTFTPNGDDVNDVFGAWGSEIKTLRLTIFDRWGERIYEGNSLDARWDGTYVGMQSPIDTYVWRIDVEELAGNKRTLYGHVNLVR